MASDELDEVNKGILHLLQQDARGSTTTEIAEQLGVSSSTVGNRIHDLEERGVITGYHPTVDYYETGMGHHLLVVATAPLQEGAVTFDDVLDVFGVVNVREMLTNNENLAIELVGRDRSEIEDSLAELNSLDVTVERMEIVKREKSQPFDRYGKHVTDGDDGG